MLIRTYNGIDKELTGVLDGDIGKCASQTKVYNACMVSTFRFHTQRTIDTILANLLLLESAAAIWALLMSPCMQQQIAALESARRWAYTLDDS